MKKKFTSFAVALVVLTVSAVPVFAHGHGRISRSNYLPAANYSVCTREDCTLSGLHSHGGTNYYAHYYGDGHDYHEYCNVANCALTGYHKHDGEYCFSHAANDGHNYHRAARGHH